MNQDLMLTEKESSQELIKEEKDKKDKKGIFFVY